MIRLDSSHPDRTPGWDTAPFEPAVIVRCDVGGEAVLMRDGRVLRRWKDPLDALQFLQDSLSKGVWREARWVGFLNYDLGRLFETLPARAERDVDVPLFVFGLQGLTEIKPEENAEEAVATPAASTWTSDFSRDEFEGVVCRAVEYIGAGDVFQVNLAQRLSVATSQSAGDIYRRLRSTTPALHGALLEFDELAVVSNSPELFLRVLPNGKVTTRPIKGTRPNAPGMADELLASAKDGAELAMIVDLLRNDLGRVCEIGTVKVLKPRELETHPTVLHTTATIEGQLRPDVGFVDLLRATFPCGSVTGAPKIRAMEIIDELERHRRGVYCGAIGYLDASGEIQFSVAIRTLTLQDGRATFGVGGGIVADSQPQAEYDETLTKAKALLAALNAITAT